MFVHDWMAENSCVSQCSPLEEMFLLLIIELGLAMAYGRNSAIVKIAWKNSMMFQLSHPTSNREETS